MHSGHRNDKGKKIINERVQGTIHEHLPRKMSDTFQGVINVKLRCHGDETCDVDV